MRHSAIYSAAPLLRQLISVGMTRFYTGWLAPAAYGIKEIADLWMIGLQQLLGQNALGAMVRFYFDHSDPDERDRVVTSSTLAVTLLAWVFAGLALLVAGDLTPLMLGPGEEVTDAELVTILRLVLVLIPLQLSTLSGFYYLQVLQRSTLYTTLQTGKLIFEVGLNFWLIGALGLGVRGFLLSMLAGEAITSLALTGWMLTTLKPRIDWGVLKPILIYAFPLVPAGLCQFGLHQFDKRLLLHFAEEGAKQASTGIYGLGYKIGYLVNAMFIGSFLQIWQPWIFDVRDPEERAALVRRICTYAVIVFAVISLGVILFGYEAVLVLDGDGRFRDAHRVVPLVTAGYVFWGLYQVAHIPLLIVKRTGRLLAINFVALLANVGANAALIPRYGFVGAGIATLVTFALLAALVMVQSRTVAGVRFEVGRIASAFACVLVAGAAAWWIDGSLLHRLEWPWIGVLPIKLAVLASLVALMWRALLAPEERRELTGWIRGGLPKS